MAKIPPALSAYAPAMFFMFMAATRKRPPQTPGAPHHTFRIEIDEMNFTVHRGDDLDAVRVIESATPPRYFIDDVEVDEATFYREHKREQE